MAAAAVALYTGIDRSTPGGLTGGSTAGLWFGIAGSLLIGYAGLLSALRKVPSWWWIGSRSTWLCGHIWLGLLSPVLLLCHGSFRWGGPLEQALWAVYGITLVSGIFGLLVQHLIPHQLTTRISREAPYEQIPRICRRLLAQADVLAEKIDALELQVSQSNLMASQVGMGAKAQFSQFYETHVRPFLIGARSPLLANPLDAEQAFDRLRALPGLQAAREPLTELQMLCDERRQFPMQERLHHWLHGWLLIHVPAAILLVLLAIAHAVIALYY
jgi:hypothetical protein